MHPSIISAIIAIAVSIITSLVIFAFTFGKMSQRIKSQDEKIDRLEAGQADLRYDYREANKILFKNTEQTAALNARLSTYIDLQCAKHYKGENLKNE